mmetsp:Transcript_13334/g.23605  ORF Transcript_13334/g.23605 Transcript_13334/m.23605 type:complete len:278 (-) Transcript_13334:1282-2115(-)
MESAETSKLDFNPNIPPWGEVGRSFTMGLVSGFAKLVMNGLNTTNLHNYETFEKYFHDRGDVGLLTVCNHTSMFDDPGVISALVPWEHFIFKQDNIRWAMCAKDVCFKNFFYKQFFLSGKTWPIERGKGVHQPVVSVAAGRLAQGDWLHIFPEGRIYYDGHIGPFRWGIGKLICETRVATGKDPIVLPFYHSGMGAILPRFFRFFGIGQQVDITIGQPMDLSNITCRCGKAGEDQRDVWRDLTARVRGEVQKLEGESPPNIDQITDEDRLAISESSR